MPVHYSLDGKLFRMDFEGSYSIEEVKQAFSAALFGGGLKTGQVIGTTDSDEELDASEIVELAESLPPGDVQLFYQTALIGRRDLHLSPDPRSGAEMTLLRMLAFRPAGTGEVAGGGGTRKPSAAKPRPVASAAPARQANAKEAPNQQAPAESKPPQKPAWDEPDWATLIPTLGLKGAVRMLAINCAYLRREGNTVHFRADKNAESVITRERQATLEEALTTHFGEPLKVAIEITEAPVEGTETPVETEARVTDERYEAARESIEADPNVQAMKNMFGAELKTDSIEPIQPQRSD